MDPTFRYTTNPGYYDLVYDVYRTIKWHYRPDNWANYTNFFDEFQKYYYFKNEDFYPIVYIAILFTIARYLFELLLCRPLINKLKIDSKSDRTKFPESFWKATAYFGLWGYCAYVLIFSGKYNYFNEPHSIWDDWALGMSVPTDIKWLYFIECGFYLHSIYATLFMDEKRKDFIVMLIHHVLTLTLIIVSFATRYHKIGILVVFVHDVTDILLEFTKCNVYLKNRNKKYYAFHDHIANIGFACFALAWFVFRLYWFPLKILYSTGVTAAHRAYHRGAGLYAFFNGLLWVLMFLDLYWFYFILLFLYKVATGQLTEVNDTRDYDEEKIAAEEQAKKSKKKE